MTRSSAQRKGQTAEEIRRGLEEMQRRAAAKGIRIHLPKPGPHPQPRPLKVRGKPISEIVNEMRRGK